jgi:hypothetical protein
MNLIGIHGKKGHGKDTLYKTALAPKLYERIALADPLKVLCLFGAVLLESDLSSKLRILAENFYRYLGSSKSPDIRKALQDYGVKVRNEYDPGYWLYLGLSEAKNIIQSGGKVAITDVRFENEARAVRGDASWMKDFYLSLKVKGAAHQEHIKHALTHYYSEGGVLPDPGAGIVVKIVRPDLTDDGDAHVSEAGLPDKVIDFTVQNKHLATLPGQFEIEVRKHLGMLEAPGKVFV